MARREDPVAEAAMLDALRRTGGRVLRGARGDLARGDVVSWEEHAARGASPAAFVGIVTRAARDGSWADVCSRCSLRMRRDGYPPDACHLAQRVRGSRLAVLYEAPRG